MSKRSLNVGVLGYANVFKKHMKRAFDECEYFVIKKIASRDRTLLSDLIFENQDVTIVSNYEEVVGDVNIDLIYVPLPNSLHCEWICKALENGKHVLVEKPLVLNKIDFDRISKIAIEKNLVVKQNFMFEYHSQFKFIQEQIISGYIGEIRSIRASFGFPPFQDLDNIRYSQSLGGGSLNDAGAYGIMISTLLLDFSQHYYVASSLNFDRERNIDLYGGAFLIDGNGKTAHINFGFDNYYQCNLEIWGSKGKISANRIFTAGPGVEPEVLIEVDDSCERIMFGSENHFVHLLDRLYWDINNVFEYNETIRNRDFINLLEEVRTKSIIYLIQ
jgi:NDP-hexose-3-ketoreductase